MGLAAFPTLSGCSEGAAGSYSVTFDSLTVEPGTENTQCVLKRLPTARAMHVNQIANTLGTGTHHVIIYKTSDSEEQPTPFDCKPFADLLHPERGVPLMISQKHEDMLKLPAGVGIALESGQMIRIEMHYINASTAPVQVTATSTFTEMSADALKDEADFAFFANTAIDLPPSSAASLGPLFLATPSALDGAKFFGFTGHEHKLGTGVTVAKSSGKDGTDTVVYDPPNFVWSEPPTVYHDPPIELPSGGGFRFTCNWQNTTASQVTFGESANDEMCVFWSYYYPSKGFFTCAHTDKIAGGLDFCCPGNPICGMLP